MSARAASVFTKRRRAMEIAARVAARLHRACCVKLSGDRYANTNPCITILTINHLTSKVK